MGLPDLVRNLIAGPVVSLAGPFRAEVLITQMIGRNTYGPIYAEEPSLALALVESTTEQVTTADGSGKLSTSKFTFFEQEPMTDQRTPPSPGGRTTVHEGDKITLNGLTTTVIKVGGLLDETGKPYIPEVWTGK